MKTVTRGNPTPDEVAPEPPPDGRVLSPAWRDTAVWVARKGPRHALAFAHMLDEMYPEPFDVELRADASALAAWLRSCAAASDREPVP